MKLHHQYIKQNLYYICEKLSITSYINAIVIDENYVYILTSRPGIATRIESLTKSLRECAEGWDILEIRIIEYQPFQTDLIEVLLKLLPKKKYVLEEIFPAIL